jgi:hypothetical protein
MSFYKFQYLHQTVEHCLTRPLPNNVDIAYHDKDAIVYTVDLPASVFASVTMSTLDPYDNEIHRFNSDSLRADWIKEYVDSLLLAVP